VCLFFSPYTYSHLGNARLDAIPTSMWACTNIYFIYLFTQSFNAMIKTAQRSVTHASQIIGTIILSTTTTTTTTELFPQPSRHCRSHHCHNRHNNRKNNVLKHAVYIHHRNHTAVKTRSRDTMPVGVTIRLQDGGQTQVVARIPTRGRDFLFSKMSKGKRGLSNRWRAVKLTTCT
jgi:hypothetical protein